MDPLYSDLRWLPRAPEDFSTLLKAAGSQRRITWQKDPVAYVFRPGPEPANQVAKVIAKSHCENSSLHPLKPLRLGCIKQFNDRYACAGVDSQRRAPRDRPGSGSTLL